MADKTIEPTDKIGGLWERVDARSAEREKKSERKESATAAASRFRWVADAILPMALTIAVCGVLGFLAHRLLVRSLRPGPVAARPR